MNHMRRRDFLSCMSAGTALGAATGWTSTRAASAAGPGTSIEAQTFASGRDDGRFVETAGFLHKYLQELKPKLAFRPDLSLPQFPAWRRAVRGRIWCVDAFRPLKLRELGRRFRVDASVDSVRAAGPEPLVLPNHQIDLPAEEGVGLRLPDDVRGDSLEDVERLQNPVELPSHRLSRLR